MLDLLTRNIKSLVTSEEDIAEEDIVWEPMSYKITVSVEYTWPSNQYWEPLLRNQSVMETNNWIGQLAKVIQPLLEETYCISDNSDEIDNASALHILLDEYMSENSS